VVYCSEFAGDVFLNMLIFVACFLKSTGGDLDYSSAIW
jgi:hypothetical protein